MTGPMIPSGPAINLQRAGQPEIWPQELVPGGRLTLTLGTAVTTTDVASSGTLAYEPFNNNRIPIFDGQRMRLCSFSASSVSLALTITSGKNYDVFGYWDGGRLRLGLSTAWASDTARATSASGVLETPISLAAFGYDGFKVNAVAYPGYGPMQGTWLGTLRASGTNAAADSILTRYLVNRYNKVPRKMYICPGYVNDNALTYYNVISTTFAVHPGGASTLKFLADGINPINFRLTTCWVIPASFAAVSGVGIDSTTTAKVEIFGNGALGTSASTNWTEEGLAEGYHTADYLLAVSGGTTLVVSDNERRGSSADPPASFILAEIMG